MAEHRGDHEKVRDMAETAPISTPRAMRLRAMGWSDRPRKLIPRRSTRWPRIPMSPTGILTKALMVIGAALRNDRIGPEGRGQRAPTPGVCQIMEGPKKPPLKVAPAAPMS
jgi:hypothetical protein